MIIAGGQYQHQYSYIYHDDILQFDPESPKWDQIGKMKQKRTNQAISIINYNSVKDYCI